MGLPTSYLITTKNLGTFLNAIRAAKAPEQFTNKFLTQLDFTSSNDRLFIGVLKGLRFLDDSGAPTQRYYDFLDQTRSGEVMAEAIREAYDDLFRINTKANELTVDEVKNKLKTLTLGQKSDNVINLMATTFKALCDSADWSMRPEPAKSGGEEPPAPMKENGQPKGVGSSAAPEAKRIPLEKRLVADLHYNIQIILPDSRDPAVFDAIFRSLREHLL